MYGVEHHQVICQQEVDAFLYTLDKGADVASTKNFYTNHIMRGHVTLSKVEVSHDRVAWKRGL